MIDFEGVKRSLKELIAIDSVKAPKKPGMPFGEGPYRALKYTLGLGESMGFLTKDVDGYAGHIEWGEGELFGVLTHVDVVPVGKDWTVGPFSGEEKDGRIYGRGTQDDKGPTIAVLYAMKALKDEGFVPGKKLRLIIGTDEESGWGCMDYYLKKEEMPKTGFSPDGDFPVINCEKGVLHLKVSYDYSDPLSPEDMDILPLPTFFGAYSRPVGEGFLLEHLGAGERVNMVPDYARAVFFTDAAEVEGGENQEDGSWQLIKKGTSAHGSQPEKGDSALKKLFAELVKYTNNPVLHLINDKYLESSTGAKLGLKLKDDVSGSLTLNVGTCAFDNGKITLGVDIRYPVTFDREEVLSRLQKNCGGGEIEVVNYHRPLYVKESEPLVQELLKAYTEVTGRPGKCSAVGGATFARALDCAVAFGPEFPGTPPTLHMADENVLVDELRLMCDIYYRALKALIA